METEGQIVAAFFSSQPTAERTKVENVQGPEIGRVIGVIVGTQEGVW